VNDNWERLKSRVKDFWNRFLDGKNRNTAAFAGKDGPPIAFGTRLFRYPPAEPNEVSATCRSMTRIGALRSDRGLFALRPRERKCARPIANSQAPEQSREPCVRFPGEWSRRHPRDPYS